MNNTWNPAMSLGARYEPAPEKLSYKMRTVGNIQQTPGPNIHGLILPGFAATPEYSDEMWRISGQLSIQLFQGSSAGNAITMEIGLFADAVPDNTEYWDERVLSRSYYEFLPPFGNGYFIHAWIDSVWIRPQPGKENAFSVVTRFPTQTGNSTFRIYTNTALFILERYRMGPDFKYTKKTVPLLVSAP